jgi:hypothetical protein
MSPADPATDGNASDPAPAPGGSMDVPSAEGVRRLGVLAAVVMGAILLAFAAWWATTP